MVLDEKFQDGVQAVADAEAVVKGLLVVLEELEGELSGDSRYYALKACVERIVGHLGVAGDRLDAYSMGFTQPSPPPAPSNAPSAQ